MVDIKPSTKRKQEELNVQDSKKRKPDGEKAESVAICKNIIDESLLKKLSSLELGSNIISAVENNDIRKVLSQIKNGCNINARTNCGKTILHFASINGFQQMVKFLLSIDADPNAKDINGYTSLHFAVMHEQIKAASMLINHGSNIQASCNSGNTPLHLACARSFELSKLLIDNGADINAVNINGQTPIRFAISTNQLSVVDTLIKEGAYVKQYLPFIETCILQVIVDGHLYLFQTILDSSYITQEKLAKFSGYSVAYGQNQIFDLLWSRGKKCSTEQMEEYLELASMKGNSYVVEKLLKNGAEFKAKSNALLSAVGSNRCEIVQLLIKHKADLNVKNSYSNTPLHLAAIAGHHEIIEILMQNGANSEITDKKGLTPIHLAVSFKSIEVLKVLIKCKANINARTPELSRPLHIAVRQGFQ